MGEEGEGACAEAESEEAEKEPVSVECWLRCELAASANSSTNNYNHELNQSCFGGKLTNEENIHVYDLRGLTDPSRTKKSSSIIHS